MPAAARDPVVSQLFGREPHRLRVDSLAVSDACSLRMLLFRFSVDVFGSASDIRSQLVAEPAALPVVLGVFTG
jgi:hypothetical protein